MMSRDVEGRWPSAVDVRTAAGWHRMGQHLSRSQFHVPFGGYKRSGLGRESGKEAIYEYLQQKSVWIGTATEVPKPFVLR